jgi:hypothetical protein
MGRPRKKEQLVNLSSRVRPEQVDWLRWEADRRFDGELSRTLRWALDQARAFSLIMMTDDPVYALDRDLNPEKYPDEWVDIPSDEERAAERLRRERAIARAYGLEEQP